MDRRWRSRKCVFAAGKSEKLQLVERRSGQKTIKKNGGDWCNLAGMRFGWERKGEEGLAEETSVMSI